MNRWHTNSPEKMRPLHSISSMPVTPCEATSNEYRTPLDARRRPRLADFSRAWNHARHPASKAMVTGKQGCWKDPEGKTETGSLTETWSKCEPAHRMYSTTVHSPMHSHGIFGSSTKNDLFKQPGRRLIPFTAGISESRRVTRNPCSSCATVRRAFFCAARWYGKP